MAAIDAAPAFELLPDGGSGRFVLTGVLSFETASAVLASGDAAFASERALTVCLSGVTHADSAGLAVLLTWVERARREGRTLAFTAIPAQLVSIARLCAVETLLSAAATAAAQA
jgi:phospholipid transport system transporter-binding protein